MQWKSHASILQAEELANDTVDEKVWTVHHSGLTILPSHDLPASRNVHDVFRISSSSSSSSNYSAPSTLAHERKVNYLATVVHHFDGFYSFVC